MVPAAKAGKNAGQDEIKDLGFCQLIVSHVENAGTFYAYTEENSMTALEKIDEQCAAMPRLVNSPEVGKMVAAFHSGHWRRGEVEQISTKGDGMIRVRMVDCGWQDFVPVSDLCQLPKDLLKAKIKCEKYKMADMKPRGRYEGYSAADRAKGKVWLEKTIDGRAVDAKCHNLVKYAGGIQMECKIGDLDLNKAALESGHVILLKDRKHKWKPPKGKKANTGKEAAKSTGNGKPCKFGATCRKKDICKFDHPLINKPCRFGAGCTRKSCKFDHSPSSKALQRAMMALQQRRSMSGGMKTPMGRMGGMSMCGGMGGMGGGMRTPMGGGKIGGKPMGGGMGGGMMKMRDMAMDDDWNNMGGPGQNPILSQMLKMKSQLENMMANAMDWSGGSGGMGAGYGGSGGYSNNMGGMMSRGYGGLSGRYKF